MITSAIIALIIMSTFLIFISISIITSSIITVTSMATQLISWLALVGWRRGFTRDVEPTPRASGTAILIMITSIARNSMAIRMIIRLLILNIISNIIINIIVMITNMCVVIMRIANDIAILHYSYYHY